MYHKKILAAVFLFLISTSSFYLAEAQTGSEATTSTTTLPLVEPIVGHCTTEAYYNGQGEYSVTWSVFAHPSNNVVYTWSGDASTTGNYSVVNQRFNSSGRRTAVVNVRVGDQEMTLRCSAGINIPNVSSTTLSQLQLIGGKCSPSSSTMSVFWSASATNTQGTTTYQWVGTDFSTSTQDESRVFEIPYTTEGVKSAQVRISSGDGQAITLSCEAKIASTTSSGCFIATAAFGTEMEPEVVVLRKFRDEKLLTNKMGEVFVGAYYKLSPRVADYIRDKEYLKSAVRAGLRPVLFLVES